MISILRIGFGVDLGGEGVTGSDPGRYTHFRPPGGLPPLTHKDLEELRQRKSEEAEFAKLVSGTDPFKALTYKIINLPFADKYRFLRGILDGPIIIKPSTQSIRSARF
jgi:hypothetical protein